MSPADLHSRGRILLSGGAAAATVAPSAASAPGSTIYGCANTKTGALRVLLKSSAKCRKGTTPLSWNTALFGQKTNKASPEVAARNAR